MPRRHTSTNHTPLPSWSGVASCQAKRKFPNKLAAERAAELKNLEDSTLNLAVYQCDYCRKWHLTRGS